MLEIHLVASGRSFRRRCATRRRAICLPLDNEEGEDHPIDGDGVRLLTARRADDWGRLNGELHRQHHRAARLEGCQEAQGLVAQGLAIATRDQRGRW
jgi:hypothetical protein